MITIFASIMRLQNCSFPFLKYVTVTILYAVFLGILGLLFSQLGNNVIIGYLASLGYWSFCQFDILTEENVLYIFPIISGEIEMGKLMILMSINSFLLVVFFLSVKETRGMYKYIIVSEEEICYDKSTHRNSFCERCRQLRRSEEFPQNYPEHNETDLHG